MSFCVRLKTPNHYKSLPEYTINSSCGKKAFLHIRNKGSYTLEMAVVLPLVAAFLVSILFFFRVLQVETQVQEALVYASRKAAAQASTADATPVLLAAAEVHFRKEVQQHKEFRQFVGGQPGGVSLLLSDLDGPEITLRADYFIKLPIAFFKVKGVQITQTSTSRKWTGDREQWTNEDYVYVTEHGTVYHCNRSCRYLDLSIRLAEYAEIGTLRNKNEHKYSECDRCVAKNNTPYQVYITDYGEVYHTTLSCSGLKRTIYMVPISETGGKGACSKCGNAKTSNMRREAYENNGE